MGSFFFISGASGSTVVLTGGSAGGLAGYLHLDELQEMLSNSRVVGVPDAGKFRVFLFIDNLTDTTTTTSHNYFLLLFLGFFPDLPNYANEYTYRNGMNTSFVNSNSSYGVDQSCIEAKESEDQWQCYFATYSYNFIDSDLFVTNSEVRNKKKKEEEEEEERIILYLFPSTIHGN